MGAAAADLRLLEQESQLALRMGNRGDFVTGNHSANRRLYSGGQGSKNGKRKKIRIREALRQPNMSRASWR